MRCLTLAQELLSRGHDVELMTGPIDVDWLATQVLASRMVVHECRPDEVPIAAITELAPNWVVIDSYRFDPAQVSALNALVPVLAIVDGDDRGLDAELYLDQNLGAESLPRREAIRARFMSGAAYSLVRDEILTRRRRDPWRLPRRRPRVLSFMGGTDPARVSPIVARALSRLGGAIELTLIAPEPQHEKVRQSSHVDSELVILGPTPELPALLGAADIVVSAAGTSAWDICALGLPAVLVAVADNQSASLAQAVSLGLTLGIDAVGDPANIENELGSLVALLTDDERMRRRLSDECLSTFDGLGKQRVAARLESHVREDIRTGSFR
jgi:spore coat polysaccharide biosynthesis predicted glycosyltransferase SpsG